MLSLPDVLTVRKKKKNTGKKGLGKRRTEGEKDIYIPLAT